MSSEILYLLDPAQGLLMLEGKISRRAHGKLREETLSRTSARAIHHVIKATSDEMWRTLNAKLRGHYQYYGIHDNWPLLMVYREQARRMAKRHLSRRSQRSYLNWTTFHAFERQHPLASPRRLTDLIAMSRRASAV